METTTYVQANEIAGEKHKQKTQPMNNEWTRLISYANFPADSNARPIHLARAGFYYTGTGEEVVCFCCGLRNDAWTEEETVFDVHQRLSPHCRYLCGEETTNVAVNGEKVPKQIASYVKDSNLRTDDNRQQTKTSSDRSTENSEHVTGQTSSSFEYCSSETVANFSNSSKELYSGKADLSKTVNGQIERYPGIRDAKPKHPDYALRSARQRSFYLWPVDHAVNPNVLSKAGFFFAGMGDCVKCFFCSGGMKNWQDGDNPWIEHARWFPKCEYVKLYMGRNICNASDLSSNSPSYESEILAENIPDDQTIEDINGIAAKLVLSKGYSQEDVENGIKSARKKYGSNELKVQHIFEYLQENNINVPRKQEPVCGKMEANETMGHVAPGYKNAELQNATNDVIVKDSTKRTKSEKQILLEENRRLKDLMTCKICLDKEAVVAFLPCGHLTSCEECAKSLRKCAICGKVIAGTVRVYQARREHAY